MLLRSSCPCIALRTSIIAGRLCIVAIAAIVPIPELIMPIIIPQKPNISATLHRDAPIDCSIPISFFLSLTRRTSIEMIFEHATIIIIMARSENRYFSLCSCSRMSFVNSYSLKVSTFQYFARPFSVRLFVIEVFTVAAVLTSSNHTFIPLPKVLSLTRVVAFIRDVTLLSARTNLPPRGMIPGS
mgnify:CR=1 FL=1